MGDGREKHPSCPICRELKIPTTYWCDVNCPANPAAWQRHTPVHKSARKLRQRSEDGGVQQQRAREIVEEGARQAAHTGYRYEELIAEALQYLSKEDPRSVLSVLLEAHAALGVGKGQV